MKASGCSSFPRRPQNSFGAGPAMRQPLTSSHCSSESRRPAIIRLPSLELAISPYWLRSGRAVSWVTPVSGGPVPVRIQLSFCPRRGYLFCFRPSGPSIFVHKPDRSFLSLAPSPSSPYSILNGPKSCSIPALLGFYHCPSPSTIPHSSSNQFSPICLNNF